MDKLLYTINRAVAPLRHRIMLAIGRAVIQATKDDAGMQTVKLSLLANETRDNVERMQEYGFTSRPLDGCEGVAVFVGGDRGHGVVVATDDRRHRKRGLEKGETAMYTDEGDYVLMKRGQIIEVVTGSKLDVTAPEAVIKSSTKITLDTPTVEATGDMNVSGTITGAAVQTEGGVDLGTHTHPGDSGGTTGEPN